MLRWPALRTWHVALRRVAGADEPDAVYLYEAFVDQAAFDSLKGGAPFKKFVGEIIPNLIEPVVFVLPFAESAVSIVAALPPPDCHSRGIDDVT